MVNIGKTSCRISPNLYILFYKHLKLEIRKEWKNSGGPPDTDTGIWDIENFTEIFGPDSSEYFYRAYLKAKKIIRNSTDQAEISLFLSIKKDYFSNALIYLNCKGDDFRSQINSFFSKYPVSEKIIDEQRALMGEYIDNYPVATNMEVFKETSDKPSIYEVEIIDNKLNESSTDFKNNQLILQPPALGKNISVSGLVGMYAKAYHYLSNSLWWIYYSTDNLFSNSYVEGHWPLFKGVLNFENFDIIEKKMNVKIDNKFDTNTVDYIGGIDFNNSSLLVLVINMNHVISHGSQLNIKVNIGKGDGDLFLGQFSNFNEEGSIFTGILVLHKIKDIQNPVPQRYFIKDNAVPEEWPEEVRFLMNFFVDSSQSFRRVPHEIHSTEKFIYTFK